MSWTLPVSNEGSDSEFRRRFHINPKGVAVCTESVGWTNFQKVPVAVSGHVLCSDPSPPQVSWTLPVSNEGTGGSPITGFVIYVRREDEAVPSGP